MTMAGQPSDRNTEQPTEDAGPAQTPSPKVTAEPPAQPDGDANAPWDFIKLAAWDDRGEDEVHRIANTEHHLSGVDEMTAKLDGAVRALSYRVSDGAVAEQKLTIYPRICPADSMGRR